MRGTWERTDGGSGKIAFLIICALLLFGDGGTVAAVGAGLFDALLGAVGAVFLLVVAGIAVLVHHARNPSQEGFVRLPGVRMPVRYELGPERPAEAGIKTGMKSALESGMPREVHQHTHYHWHGAEEGRQAEILRRQEG